MVKSIHFRVSQDGCDVTIHKGVTPEITLCTPKEEDTYDEFASLCWREWDLQRGVNSQVNVYLSRGEVEALRDMLNEQLALMGQTEAAEEGGGEK